MKIGYYIFYGSGDYHKPINDDLNWVYNWNFKEWKQFIDSIIKLKADTIMIYLNGHNLQYESVEFPDLIDSTSCKKGLLLKICKYIKHKGLKLVAVFTTTGHAGGYVNKHPDLKIQISDDQPDIEQTLVSFPEHLRKGKLQKKDGAAQLGFGVLCHHKEGSKSYALAVATELITLYGSFFDAITLHPPESASPCVCSLCCDIYKKETGLNLKEETFQNKCSFFINSYLKFQNNILIPSIQERLPDCEMMQFTIPWFFEINFNDLLSYIPTYITLIEWDYNLEEARINGLSLRLKKYIDIGYKVIFMPTAGFSINSESKVENQIKSIHRQIHIAEESGCVGITHFIGPRISEYMEKTSHEMAHSD